MDPVIAGFDGAIKTYHATHQQSWTCNNGQSEATCRAAYAGYVWKYSIWTALSGQLWVEDNTYTMDPRTGSQPIGSRHPPSRQAAIPDRTEAVTPDRHCRTATGRRRLLQHK